MRGSVKNLEIIEIKSTATELKNVINVNEPICFTKIY